MGNLWSRMIRAARLESALYEEVESDTSATGQALLVVVLAAIANGIGSIGMAGEPGFFAQVIAAILGWIIWAFLTLIIGTKLLPQENTEADMGQMLRTIGFASSPGMLRVLGLIRPFYSLISFVISVWMLVAMVVAVRQALDYTSTGRAVLVCVIGWIVYLLFLMMFGKLLVG